MIYFDDGNILIRDMTDSDPSIIFHEETEQGYHRTKESFSNRLIDRQEGKAIPLVAEYNGKIAGYSNIYLYSPDALTEETFCNIIDFGVFIKYRKLGIGGKLMDAAEQIIAKYSDTAYLSVGLHSGYGSAHRIYIKRGYIPDGTGAWYAAAVCNPYKSYCLDDDLILKLSKKLR